MFHGAVQKIIVVSLQLAHLVYCIAKSLHTYKTLFYTVFHKKDS